MEIISTKTDIEKVMETVCDINDQSGDLKLKLELFSFLDSYQKRQKNIKKFKSILKKVGKTLQEKESKNCDCDNNPDCCNCKKEIIQIDNKIKYTWNIVVDINDTIHIRFPNTGNNEISIFTRAIGLNSIGDVKINNDFIKVNVLVVKENCINDILLYVDVCFN